MTTLKLHAQNALLNIKLLWLRETLWNGYLRRIKDPQALQEKILTRIIERNKNSEFGKAFRFSEIKSIADFRQKVPIAAYTDLEPYIERQLRGQKSVTDEPAIYCALTSGTSKAPKHIPITERVVRSYERSQVLSMLRQADAVPGLYSGYILAFMSPAVDSKTPSGISCGSMSGFLYERASSFAAARFIVPSDVSLVKDFEEKLFLSAAFALVASPLTMITTPNPSTLLRFHDVVCEKRRELARAIRTRTIPTSSQSLLFAFRRLLPHVNKGKKIADLLDGAAAPSLDQLFPHLRGITTWVGGNCGYFAEKLRKRFVSPPPFLDPGFLASEFRGSLVVEPLTGEALPTIHENFLEFAPVDAWEAGQKDTVLAHEIQEGQKYYVIATTEGGLYRYFINDIIEAAPSSYSIPSIRFLQKGSGTSSITGEKLSESQVLGALSHDELEQHGVIDFILVADLESQRYRIYVESTRECPEIAELLDLRLSESNMEYAAKRSGERLFAVEYFRVRSGTFELRRKAAIKHRGREGQYKAPKLLAKKDVFFDFDNYRMRTA